jgi:hypothetical protein
LAKIKVKSFSDIDFLTINASEDEIILPDGVQYRFSDRMCDNCWTAGTVMERIDKSPFYHCILCENELEPIEFINDFLEPPGDTLRFLLPKKWSASEKEDWYQNFKERRIQQEEVRNHILKEGNE